MCVKFLKVKYYSIIHHVKKKNNKKNSYYWKNLLGSRDQVEKHILWRYNAGDISLWWDNWLGIGALANIVQLYQPLYMKKIKQIRICSHLHFEEIQQSPEYIIELIQSYKFDDPNNVDTAIWMPSSTGFFTTTSA